MIQEARAFLTESLPDGQCPNCGGNNISAFYTVRDVPVHSVLLMHTRQAALEYPRGNITLSFCPDCSFVTNATFDASLHSYSPEYEETQGFSPTFQAFHRALAQSLIEKYNIRRKRVLEIGCGKGEFLSLLCDMGENSGIGYDPAFVPERNPCRADGNVEFIQEFYTAASAGHEADVICCKMTLEHIPDTERFIQAIRDSIGTREDTLVFFQVPAFARIMEDIAFWDVYYEHCSYFTDAALRHLFERCGFRVVDTHVQYDRQYLQIVAYPTNRREDGGTVDDLVIADTQTAIRRFADSVNKKVRAWNNFLEDVAEMNRRVVLWGSGSKAVAFLSAMQAAHHVEYAVDINSYRHNHYIPGTGQRIVSPDFLIEYKPDIVIAMNAIYYDEIDQMLQKLGCTARLLTV